MKLIDEQICVKCKHQYFMMYKKHLKCMNEESDKYGEDIEPLETCEKWESMKVE